MRYISKKLMIMAGAIAFAAHAGAQSVDDGIKMYNYKKYRTAEQMLTPLAASDARANYYLGLSYLYDGNASKAADLFSKFPDDYANVSGTARVAFVNKDVAKGMQIAKDLAAKAKKKDYLPEKYAADAITYTTGGDYSQAVTWYKDALTKNDDLDMHLSLGDAYRAMPGGGGGGEAMNNYEYVTDKQPANSFALYRIGDLWYASHSWQLSLDNYTKAKDADPNNPLPYKALAESYANLRRYQDALTNIKKYYDLCDKTTDDKILYLADLYLAQSYCDAVTFGKGMMSNPNDVPTARKVEVTGIIGFSEANCGDSTEALRYLRSYFQMQVPSKITPQAYIELGKLYLKLDLLDSAGFYYSKGVEGDTSRNKTDVYRTIAEAFRLKKDYCKSADWYDNLVKANPQTQPLDYFWRSVMYFYCRSFQKAMDAGADFEKNYPTEATAVFWHARAAAAIDSEATQCTASPFFTKWLGMVGPAYEKKNDLKTAYEYLVLCNYNQKNTEQMKTYMEKLREIAPADELLKQIEEAEKAGQAPKKTPAKTKK